MTGSAGANTIATGSGNDTIDGGGGADTINAGGGADTVTYHGTETSIDGGAGTNTLVLASATDVNLVNADQTTGDSTNVTNFQNVNASGISSDISITGSSSANTLTGGSGNDTIDGGGGADTINAGGGNDTVTYHGTETSINGGTGSNTLVLSAATTVNLANADQTSGDSTNVTGFQNIDASGLSSGLTLTGSSGDNTITGSSGNDTINGGGGQDHLFGGGGDDIFIIDGSSLALGATINGGSWSQLGQPVGQFGQHHRLRAFDVADERSVHRLHCEQRECGTQPVGQPDQPDLGRREQYAGDADKRRRHGEYHRSLRQCGERWQHHELHDL